MKICGKCNNNKDLSEFHKDKSKKDGHTTVCRKCALAHKKMRYESDKDNILARNKKWSDDNKELRREYNKKWRADNSDSYKRKKRQYFQENKVSIYEKRKTARLDSVLVRLSGNLRNRLSAAIKNDYKKGSAVKDLGCSIEGLKRHLESKFQIGMTWDNWSIDGWHIDHIKPLSSFNLCNKEELMKACHYTNLQPLWAKDNLSKNNRTN